MKLGWGCLLPLSVGALALVDMSHLVQEAIEHSHFDNEALRVAESEMHRTAYLKSQNKREAKFRKRMMGLLISVQRPTFRRYRMGICLSVPMVGGRTCLVLLVFVVLMGLPFSLSLFCKRKSHLVERSRYTIPPAGSPVGSPVRAVQAAGVLKRFLNSMSGS